MIDLDEISLGESLSGSSLNSFDTELPPLIDCSTIEKTRYMTHTGLPYSDVPTCSASWSNGAKRRIYRRSSWMAEKIVNALSSPTRSNCNASPTAWLDGLRGIAAYLVFSFHIFQHISGEEGGWSYCESPEYCNWYRLPYVRLFYAS